MTDLLLVTLLADASQNAMAGEYNSLPDGVVLVGTLIFWNYSWTGSASVSRRSDASSNPLRSC